MEVMLWASSGRPFCPKRRVIVPGLLWDPCIRAVPVRLPDKPFGAQARWGGRRGRMS